MWSRAELKTRAKTKLSNYYWWGVLACFVAGLLGAGSESGGAGIGNSSRSFSNNNSGGSISSAGPEIFAFIVAFLAIFFIILIAVIAFSIFISTVVQVGKLNFFLQSGYQGQSAGIGCLFFGFSSGSYINIVKTMFLRGLYQTLWTLLLIIPGIVKHYEYYMVPYLLAENPGLNSSEAFRQSKQMMDGNKLDTFVLEFSFIGWEILCVLTCGIGFIFLAPYMQATFTELYLQLKGGGYEAPKAELF